jgi:hypothetical protein
MGEAQEGKMSPKEELVKALVHVRQSWVEMTGAATIFKSANIALGHDDILVIPATEWDISDQYFVMVTCYPRALEHQEVRSVKLFIPKEAVILIVELKSPDGVPALGYRKVVDE